MAYQYTKIADAGAIIAQGTIPVGGVFQYAGNDYVFAQDFPSQYPANTSSMNYFLSNGYITHLDGSTTAISDPDSAVYLRSTVADGTLTEKTKSFALGIMSTVNAIIAKVNSLTGRVTAVETLAASKAAINDNTLYSTTETLSSSRISDVVANTYHVSTLYTDSAVQTAKNDVIAQLSGVDGTQLQALNDLSVALQANADADGVIANDLLNKLDFSKVQALTDAQAAQARENIKFDTAVNAAVLATVGDVTLFNPDAILATALTLN